MHKNDFRYTVLDILKNAGYRTVFLSNQARWGKNDSPTTVLTRHADERIFFHDIIHAETHYDEILLPEVKKQIGNMNGPTLLILHLHGSHLEFSQRYPPSFRPPHYDGQRGPRNAKYDEKTAERINHYDNSIAYTDMILGEIIRVLGNLQTPACMLYFSDHGECPEAKKYARAPGTTYPTCYEIPFILYTNKPYHEAYPDFITAARNNLHARMQTDSAIWSILSCAQITFDGFPFEHDIFSSSYRPPKDRLLENDLPYKKSRTPAKPLYPRKK